VFAHAWKLGLEGIVSKRKDSRYCSGRSPHWIKSKNPNAPAVKREAEEDWGRPRCAYARRIPDRNTVYCDLNITVAENLACCDGVNSHETKLKHDGNNRLLA
jgi:hypothetical protein